MGEGGGVTGGGKNLTGAAMKFAELNGSLRAVGYFFF